MTANPIGIGIAASGNALSVLGNIYASNAITTTNVVASLANITSTANVQTLVTANPIGIGIAASGNALSVLGNVYASNSITTTNVVTNLANISSTANTLSIYGQSGSIGINTSTNLGASLQVQGNVYASNALSGANLTMSGTIYYNEDLFKRGPYLLPSAANAATIQAWISATCNASSQPTKSWWATSPKPVYANATPSYSIGSNFMNSGSVLLPDGRVLFVPINSGGTISFFNPYTGLSSYTTPSGDLVGSYFGGVLLPTGNVVFVPNTSNIGMYNPVTNSFKNVLQITTTATFVAGVLDPTGNVVMMPYTIGGNLVSFNPVLNIYSNIVARGDGRMRGAVLLPNGNVVCVPDTNGNILQFQPSTQTVSNIYTIGSSGTSKFAGGVLAPNGNVILVPFSSNVGVYNPTLGTFSNIVTGTPSSSGFEGGCLLPSGNIVFIPRTSGNVGMFDPSSLTYSNCTPTNIPSATSAFTGGTVLPDGRVVFAPAQSGNVGVLSTMVPAPREFCLSPFFNKY